MCKPLQIHEYRKYDMNRNLDCTFTRSKPSTGATWILLEGCPLWGRGFQELIPADWCQFSKTCEHGCKRQPNALDASCSSTRILATVIRVPAGVRESALESGHDQAVLFAHYRELSDRKTRRDFSISNLPRRMPEEKIVSISARCYLVSLDQKREGDGILHGDPADRAATRRSHLRFGGYQLRELRIYPSRQKMQQLAYK